MTDTPRTLDVALLQNFMDGTLARAVRLIADERGGDGVEAAVLTEAANRIDAAVRALNTPNLTVDSAGLVTVTRADRDALKSAWDEYASWMGDPDGKDDTHHAFEQAAKIIARHRLTALEAGAGEREAQAETYRDMHWIATHDLGYASILEALEAAPRILPHLSDFPTPSPSAGDEAGPFVGAGWVYFNEDSGEEYALNHPIESGECVEAQHIRRSTLQEDCLHAAYQEQWRKAQSASPSPEAGQESAEVERLREALTPYSETKVAYMQEFSWTEWLPDENGIDQGHERVVPWTTIKEIMAAIRHRAGAELLDEADCLAALAQSPEGKASDGDATGGVL